jgi:transposase
VSFCNRIEQGELGYWIHYATSAKISRRFLSGGDWKGLLDLIEEVRARVSRETGRAVDVISCYEAGYDGFWLHRLLEAHGIRNYVIDPASLQVDRRARRVKTDRIDTERLLRSARSLVGEIFHRKFNNRRQLAS